MYSHSNIRSTEQPAREPYTQYALVALPPAARTPSCFAINRSLDLSSNDEYFFDAGAEADNEKTPAFTSRLTSRRLRSHKKTNKKRRFSQLTFVPSDTPSTHIPSPYLPCIKRWPHDHPKAAWNPRTHSISTVDSLEFLDEYSNKRQKTLQVLVTVDNGRRNAEEMVFWALERRSSDPTYQPPVALKTMKKRRKVADPTYRNVPSPSVSPVEQPLPTLETKTKKRKRTADPTYRDAPGSETSSDNAVVSSPRMKKRKVVGIKLKLQNVQMNEEAPVLKRRKKSVDLKGEYLEDAGEVEEVEKESQDDDLEVSMDSEEDEVSERMCHVM